MDERVDYRLKILGRYRQGTPRERFNLWFGHPGLRHGFDALDRERPNAKYPAALARPDRVARAESNGCGSSAPAKAVGLGRGR